MGGGGVSYGGAIRRDSRARQNDITADIEIPEDDPNFLPRVAQKNPPEAEERARSVVGSFVDGMYSWPFDYTLGIHWAVGMTGLYGSTVKDNCKYHGNRVLDVLEAGVRGTVSVTYYLIFRGLLWKVMSNETARNLVGETLEQTELEDFYNAVDQMLPSMGGMAQTAGRYASGQFFKRWMQSRVRGAKLGRYENAANKTVGLGNFVILSWGSAIHSSIDHPSSFGLIEIFVSWINGDSSYIVGDDIYKELFTLANTMARNPAFSDTLGEDYDLFVEFMEEIVDFGKTGMMDG